MTKEDIIKQMAKDAGGVFLSHGRWVLDTDELVRFAKLIAAAEREECAMIIQRAGLPSIATAIRARGN